jgi:predicted oxidoreductase
VKLLLGLTIGGTVTDDKATVCQIIIILCFDHCSILVQAIIKTAFENGINMFDVAESYSGGKSEIEL